MRAVRLIVFLGIISFVFIGCATTHGTSPKGLEIPIENAAISIATDLNGAGYKVVKTAELKKWYDEGKQMIVISALPPEEDKAYGMLPNAVNGAMPKTEKELTQANKDGIIKAAGSDKSKTIVVYCGFVSCRRSSIGAKILVDAGYKSVYKYPAGITGWTEMNYPVSK